MKTYANHAEWLDTLIEHVCALSPYQIRTGRDPGDYTSTAFIYNDKSGGARTNAAGEYMYWDENVVDFFTPEARPLMEQIAQMVETEPERGEA